MKKKFIIGYPKSGNTWLSKLTAQLVRANLRDDNQIHSEFNSRNGFENSEYQIVKTHDLPMRLVEREGDLEDHAIYIYRDPRDVSISSFFYFTGNHYVGTEDFHNIKNTERNSLLLNYIAKFCTHGPFRTNNTIGLWDRHIDIWQKRFAEMKATKCSFISYENLVSDTQSTLTQLADEQGWQGLYDEANLSEVIKKESFSVLKERFKKQKDPQNMSFLRSGKAGDWINYYNRDSGLLIHGAFFKKMQDLGYEDDFRWFEKLAPAKSRAAMKRLIDSLFK